MCGGASAPAVTQTQPSQPSGINTTTPPEPQKAIIQKPKPTLNPEQVAKQKCDSATKKISTKIKTQKKKKVTNLIALNKSLTSLQGKISNSQEKNLDVVSLAEKVDLISESISEYQGSYDEYTNKLYQISWVICGEDKTLIKELELEEATLAKPLPKAYMDIQKQVNQAKYLKLDKMD